MDEEYGAIDAILLEAVKKIQGSTSASALDKDLISLPQRMRGLGISLYGDSHLDAFTSSQMLAEFVLSTVCPDQVPIQESERANEISNAQTDSLDEAAKKDDTNVDEIRKKTRERRERMHQTKLTRVQEQLNDAQEAMRLENASFLGRCWMSALPNSRRVAMNDNEMAAALNIRLLSHPPIEEGDIYRLCSLENFLGHADTCRVRYRQTINKHDRVNKLIHEAISANPDVHAVLEPNLGGSNDKRADIQIDTPSGSTFVDLTIVSVTKSSARGDNARTLAAAESRKMRKYAFLGNTFRPLAISAGGQLGQDSAKTYQMLQSLLTPSQARRLDSDISLSLVRVRARTWAGYRL